MKMYPLLEHGGLPASYVSVPEGVVSLVIHLEVFTGYL